MAKLFLIEDIYLPIERWGFVESYILRHRPSFIGPILPVDVMGEYPLREVCWRSIGSAARSLTERFDEKPFYICFSGSKAINAVVADVASFHVVIVGEELCKLIAQLIAGLAKFQPLQRFLTHGDAPQAAEGPGVRTRDEAVEHLIRAATGPSSDEEGDIVARLMMLAVHFLAAHEVGHVALGHLESRLMQEGLTAEVDEHSSESVVESRALEWDADGFAGAATLWFTGASPQLPELAEVFPDHLSGMRHFMVAAYVFFTAMDAADAKSRPSEERTHPPPMIRLSLMVAIVAQVCGAWGVVTPDEAWEASVQANRAVEIALHELGGGSMEPALANSLQAEAEVALNEVGQTMQILRPSLNRARLVHYFWAQGY